MLPASLTSPAHAPVHRLPDLDGREATLAARLAELERSEAVYQAVIDAVGRLETTECLIPEILRIVANAFGTQACAYFEHMNSRTIFLRFWFFNGEVYGPEKLASLVDPHIGDTMRFLANGFTAPDDYLGYPTRERTQSTLLDHRTTTIVPRFHEFACAMNWHLELNTPLVVDGRADGALVIHRDEHHPFTAHEVALAERLSRPLAIAMHANRLADELRKRSVESALAVEREHAAFLRAAHLEQVNQELTRRDLMLEGLAAASQILITRTFFEQAVVEALAVFAKSAGFHRAGLVENIDAQGNPGQTHWRVITEWNDPRFPRQTDMSVKFGSWDGAEREYHALSRGTLLVGLRSKPFNPQLGQLMEALQTHVTVNVPIELEERFWGCFALDDCEQERDRSEGERAVLCAAARVFAIALHRHRTAQRQAQAEARLIEERHAAIERRAAESEQLACMLQGAVAASRVLLNESTFGDALNRWLRHLAQSANSNRAAVGIFDSTPERRFVGTTVVADWVEPSQTSIAGHVIQGTADFSDWLERLYHGESIVASIDSLRDPASKDFWQRLNCHANVVVPIQIAGQSWGWLCLDFAPGVEHWKDPALLAVLTTAADGLSAAIRRDQALQAAMAEREARERSERERAVELAHTNETLRRSATVFAESTDPQQAVGAIFAEIVRAAEADVGYLFHYLPSTNTLAVEHWVRDGERGVGFDPLGPTIHRAPFNADITPAFRTFSQRRDIFFISHDDIDDQAQPMIWPGILDWHKARGHFASCAIPILAGERSLGIVGMAWKKPIALTSRQRDVLFTLTHQVAVSLTVAELAAAAREAALVEERNRMAREIHDTLAQGFAATLLHLRSAESMLRGTDAPSEAIDHLRRAMTTASQHLTEARRSVDYLRPEMIDPEPIALRLTHLVQRLANDFPAQRVALSVRGSPQVLPTTVQANLTRIAQEALTNALRHSGEPTVDLELAFDEPGRVRLSIADRGRGFDAEGAVMNDSSGYGLQAMRERADRIGAELTLITEPGRGMQVIVVWNAPTTHVGPGATARRATEGKSHE